MVDHVDLLAAVPLFSDVDRKHLRRLSKDFSERTFPPGSVVVREGDAQGIGFFIVAQGEAAVTIGGRELRTLGPGDYFGELALLTDRVRTATITATTDLRCLVMTLWDFRSFVHGNAGVAWKLLEHLGDMLHERS